MTLLWVIIPFRFAGWSGTYLSSASTHRKGKIVVFRTVPHLKPLLDGNYKKWFTLNDYEFPIEPTLDNINLCRLFKKLHTIFCARISV